MLHLVAVVTLVCMVTVPNGIESRKLSSDIGEVKFEWTDGTIKRSIPDNKAWTEADFYNLPVHHRNKRATSSYRSGSATETHSCGYVRTVPSELRYSIGLDYFYQKYTEAYGIPVLGSNQLPDDALMRACYVTRFLFADHSGIREWYYKNSGRIAVMSVNEVTTDIPEHSDLDPYYDTRARGLGATESRPICTGAEENVLCYSNDRYSKEDILLHEMAHGVHNLGAKYAISGWDSRLQNAYYSARSSGLWDNTYAMSTYMEYFAEGSQSFFSCNSYADPPNGIHNNINTREKLMTYDPTLYNLILETFPCANTYLKRCETTRAEENAQQLKMNCNSQTVEPTPCVDNRLLCGWRARRGQCQTNREYMLQNCKRSCNAC